MLSPNEAFIRLNKDGAFVDKTNEVHIHWYWHALGNGYKCMASRNLDGNSYPTFFHEFHVNEAPILRKR